MRMLLLCSHMSSFFFYFTSVCLEACLFGYRRSAFEMQENGCVRCWALFLWARALPVGLKSRSLAIDDNRYLFNETKLFARECYLVVLVPCAVILLLLFCALSDPKAQAKEMRPQSCWDDSWRCLCMVITFSKSFFQKLAAYPRCFRCLRRFVQLCQLLALKKFGTSW